MTSCFLNFKLDPSANTAFLWFDFVIYFSLWFHCQHSRNENRYKSRLVCLIKIDCGCLACWWGSTSVPVCHSVVLCSDRSVSVISVNKTEPYWSFGGQSGDPHHSTTPPLHHRHHQSLPQHFSFSHIILGLNRSLKLYWAASLVFLLNAWCISLRYILTW